MAKQVNGAIYYGIGLDNKQLKTDALQSQRILQGIGDTAVSEGARIDNTFRNLAKSAGLVFGTQQVIQFGRSIVQVRGEFQKLETAFGVLLGNKAQADKLMADAVTLAATTPFGLQDVSAGAKQLLAYGFAAEDIIEDLRRLGDVSAGLGLPLERLTYLYGTTMTQGRLYTRDLMQFTTSGIPLLQALADQFSVSTSEVQKLVEAGEVGFPEVQKAIYAMTGEGGQFNNMMGELSKTIPGQIEKLKDAWQVMLNDIGKEQQGVIAGSVDAAAYLVENYETVGKVIVGLIATYGAYRAAIITNNVVLGIQQQMLLQTAISGQALTKWQALQAVMTTRLTKLQALFNRTALANPYVLVTTLVVGLVAAMWSLSDSTTAAERAQERLNKRQKEFDDREKDRRARIDELVRTIQDETQTLYAQITAYEELQKLSPALTKAYKREELAIADLGAANKVLNAEQDKRNYENDIQEAKKAEESIARITAAILKYNEAHGLAELRQGPKMWVKELDAQQSVLDELQRKIEEHNRRVAEAEFNALPPAEKIKIKEDQLAKIRSEFEKANAVINKEMAKLPKEAPQEIRIPLRVETTGGQQLSGWQTPSFSSVNTIDLAQARADALRSEEQATQAEIDALKAANQKKSKLSAEELKRLADEARRRREQAQRDAEALKKLEKDFADDVAQARIDAMDDGLEKTLAQNELNFQRELAQIKEQERELLVARKKLLSTSDQKTLDALAQQMTSDYKGNVDLLARPVIDAAKLAQKGWEDAGEGIATVFSSQFGIEDASGKVREILITPILPNGSVLSPEELENYVFETLQGSKDILEADGKGIVLAIDVDPNGSAGDKLHDLQEQYYDLLSLTAEEQEGFATQRGSAATERDRENAEARKKEVERQKQEAEKLLQDYGSYLEKRAALTEQWEAKIAKTPEKYRAGARAKMTSELAALDDEYQQFSQGIENLFEHTSKKSIDELERVSARAKAIFTALKNNDYEAYLSAEGNSGNAMTREQFDVFRNSKRDMEETADGIENINRKVFESQSAFKRLGQAIKEALNGDAKKQAFADIGAALGEISDMAQVVGDSVGQIFDAFGNDEAAGIANDIAGIIGGVGQVGQGVAKIMSGDIVGGIMDGVKGIANTITSIFSLSDRTNEKHIQALQQRYDALAKQIDSIDDKIDRIRELQDKSYSTERQKNIDEETKALEEQNAKQQEQIEIIRKQIEEERDKSKTDKDRIKAWEKDIENLNKQIEENNRQIEENKERRIDAIYGQDIQQAIEDFANAYADAWTSGIPSGQSLKKQVRDMIKAQVLEMIKAAPELTEALKYLRETLLPAITADNIITPEEWAQIEEYMNGLGDKLDQKFGGLMGAFEEDVNRLASSKGIATASQDSVDELNGRITVIQGHTFSIVESVKILVANSSKILLHLAGIERNTGRLEAIEANIGAVRADLSSMKAAVNDIAVKGIKLKQ